MFMDDEETTAEVEGGAEMPAEETAEAPAHEEVA